MANVTKTVLTDECWTVSSYLHSAASKFEEIERGLLADDRPNIRDLAKQFTKQREEAIRLASLFANADSVTIVTLPDEEECEKDATVLYEGFLDAGDL